MSSLTKQHAKCNKKKGKRDKIPKEKPKSSIRSHPPSQPLPPPYHHPIKPSLTSSPTRSLNISHHIIIITRPRVTGVSNGDTPCSGGGSRSRPRARQRARPRGRPNGGGGGGGGGGCGCGTTPNPRASRVRTQSRGRGPCGRRGCGRRVGLGGGRPPVFVLVVRTKGWGEGKSGREVGCLRRRGTRQRSRRTRSLRTRS